MNMHAQLSFSQLQQRVAKAQAQFEVKREQFERVKAKAVEIFGTDDVATIQAEIAAIKQRNLLREQFKNNVMLVTNKVLCHIEAGEIVPEPLLEKLQQAKNSVDTAIKRSGQS